MQKKSITDWVHACFKIAVDHGWYEGDGVLERVRDGTDDIHVDRLNPKLIPEKLCLIHSEVSECLESYRNNDLKPRLGKNDKPEGFPSELADIVIRCFDLAGALGIDLEAAIEEKSSYNRNRPYRHGGKLA